MDWTFGSLAHAKIAAFICTGSVSIYQLKNLEIVFKKCYFLSHTDRVPSQRPRDPYSLSIPGGSGRFGRSNRVPEGGVDPNVGVIDNPGHWPESRMKIPDSR